MDTSRFEQFSSLMTGAAKSIAKLKAAQMEAFSLSGAHTSCLCRLYEAGSLTQGEVVAFINYMTQILIALVVVANLVVTFTKAAASELHVFAGAVRDIINRSFDSFLHDDVKLAKTVEPLEACIDDINVNVKSRHIERLTTGQCTIELGFVLTDISTNFERVSDHCSNIAVYQIQVPKDEYDTHEYLQNVKHQEHAEFDREEMAYEKRYRLPDVAKAQTAEAGE